jgi:single-strand DNA-binding protein
MFNHITIYGNLVRDVEFKKINELSICKFSIAHNKGVKKNDVWENQITFVDCVHFSDKSKLLLKGASVIISGQLKQENWKTPEGLNRSKLIIIVDDILTTSKITNFKNSDDESTINYADRLKEPELDKIKFAKINKMLESISMDVKPSDELPF